MKKNNVLFLVLGALLSCNAMMAMKFNNQSIETNNNYSQGSSSSSSSSSNNNDEDEKPFKCPYQGCTKSFTQKHNLTRHLKTHNTEKSYKCILCPEVFTQSNSLNRHIKNLHPEAKKAYECQKCHERFDTINSRNTHQRKCKVKKQDQPKQKSFLPTDDLFILTPNKDNSQQTQSKKNYSEQQQKSYNQQALDQEQQSIQQQTSIKSQQQKNTHKRKRDENENNSKKNKKIEERPYKCPYKDCPKSFKLKGQLTQHIKIHTRGEPTEDYSGQQPQELLNQQALNQQPTSEEEQALIDFNFIMQNEQQQQPPSTEEQQFNVNDYFSEQ
jgi:uncharacterized Zn-finger protein